MTTSEWLAAKARSYHRDAQRMEGLAVGVDGMTGEEWGAVYRAVSAELTKCAKESGGGEDISEAALDPMDADTNGLGEEDHLCHRVGTVCKWDGCPNQFDDRAASGCFLVQLDAAHPTKLADALLALETLAPDDAEASHGEADAILLEFVPDVLAQAYRLARTRCGFWYA